MNQLSLFDFVSTGEDQDEVMPVLKELNQIDIVNQESQPIHPMQAELDKLEAWIPLAKTIKDLTEDLEKERAEFERARKKLEEASMRKDLWGDPVPPPPFMLEWFAEAELAVQKANRTLVEYTETVVKKFWAPRMAASSDLMWIRNRMEYLRERLAGEQKQLPDPASPAPKAEVQPAPSRPAWDSLTHSLNLALKLQSEVGPGHPMHSQYQEQEVFFREKIRERDGESTLLPKLVGIRWSLGNVAHLAKPDLLKPICGASDGHEGQYTHADQAFGWETCTRGITPMCRECAGLELGQRTP